jgi:oligopeptide/dipeptide ABC transporter ATP-binding protein
MYLGEIVELAPSEKIWNDPAHPYSKALLSAIPKFSSQDKSIQKIILKGEMPSPFNPPTGCSFHTRCPFATPICRSIKPQLKEKEPGHFAACHLQPVKNFLNEKSSNHFFV